MVSFRTAVTAILDGTAPAPALIPAVEPPAATGGVAGRPTLRRFASGDLVKQMQAKIGAVTDGDFGAKTEAALRAFQTAHGLVPDGIVGPKTWMLLDTVPVPAH